ncbi:MAG: Appr-1-p processing protein [Alphaproteobacteria bacterium]|nr:Appr-1-p processing protein [Alphaproteobacteria bacterium]
MAVQIVKGDLLKQDVDAIVNTVNCVGVMGKGIALQFKRKWPDNFKAYEKACKAGQVKTGKMFVLDLGALHNGKPEFIINFPTKDHWREKSKLSYVEEGLQDLVRVICELNIKSIAIPPLGCGNGGLGWDVVRKMIETALCPLDVDVRLFSPSGAPDSKSMETRTERPTMTIGRAVLIKLLSIYREMDYSLSRIEIQKLCYFAQEAGESLRLNYAKNQYGPYADNLRHVLDKIEGHFTKGAGDNDMAVPQIVLMPGALEEAETFLSNHPESAKRIQMVADLIEGFETPYGMELLSTVHWVAVKDKKAANRKEAAEAVYSWKEDKPDWNERKKALMKEPHIAMAWDRLEAKGWLN